LWIADCGLKIEVLKPQSEIPLTKVSVFRFQFFRFISLTPESLTPETSNSEICHHKSPPFFGTICALNTSKSFPEITGNEQQNVGFE
jgi:hypothetical protein